jgi:TM2 domain-containing membrane protein YozV
MKPAVKAALLSGIVFPGLGQIYLKRYLRGLLTMVPVFLGITIIVGIAAVGAMETLNRIAIEGGTLDMNTVVNLAATHSLYDAAYSKVLLLFILCCWVFSVIDGYRIGKRKELATPKT